MNPTKKELREHHRALATVPFKSCSICRDREPPDGVQQWTLTEEGKTVSTWPETNAPGLGLWLDRLLTAHAGAWHIAREPLERDTKLADVSADGGDEIANRANERHAKLDALIGGCLERGERTRDYTKLWADEFKVSVDTVERRIKRIKAIRAGG
jgi:hypothetical protein